MSSSYRGSDDLRCHPSVRVDGLPSMNSLPDVFAGDLVDRCFGRLQDEWKPSTPTEEFLVRELARHESALERAERIEAAILRRAVCHDILEFSARVLAT